MPKFNLFYLKYILLLSLFSPNISQAGILEKCRVGLEKAKKWFELQSKDNKAARAESVAGILDTLAERFSSSPDQIPSLAINNLDEAVGKLVLVNDSFAQRRRTYSEPIHVAINAEDLVLIKMIQEAELTRADIKEVEKAVGFSSLEKQGEAIERKRFRNLLSDINSGKYKEYITALEGPEHTMKIVVDEKPEGLTYHFPEKIRALAESDLSPILPEGFKQIEYAPSEWRRSPNLLRLAKEVAGKEGMVQVSNKQGDVLGYLPATFEHPGSYGLLRIDKKLVGIDAESDLVITAVYKTGNWPGINAQFVEE